MTMILYAIPNCNTVKKARAWLAEHQLEVVFHNFKKDGLTQTTVDNWLQQLEWEALVNRRGMTWRKLTDEEKAAVSDSVSAMRLMLDKHSVIKRPVLECDGKVLCVGFDEEVYRNVFL